MFESKYEPKGKLRTLWNFTLMESIEKEIKIKIPQDFKEAFEKDQVAYELYQNLPYPQKSKFIYGISHFKTRDKKKNIEKRLTELKR